MEFNVNDYVYIKLTDKGRAILAAEEYGIMPTEDEDGWSKWQLWNVMEAFGKHIRLGGIIPFETKIKIGV